MYDHVEIPMTRIKMGPSNVTKNLNTEIVNQMISKMLVSRGVQDALVYF